MAADDVSGICVQVFHLDAAYVVMAIYACCKRMFHVARICFRCFKHIFQMFHLDIAEVYMDVA
jgi:hypothetical protein